MQKRSDDGDCCYCCCDRCCPLRRRHRCFHCCVVCWMRDPIVTTIVSPQRRSERSVERDAKNRGVNHDGGARSGASRHRLHLRRCLLHRICSPCRARERLWRCDCDFCDGPTRPCLDSYRGLQCRRRCDEEAGRGSDDPRRTTVRCDRTRMQRLRQRSNPRRPAGAMAAADGTCAS